MLPEFLTQAPGPPISMAQEAKLVIVNAPACVAMLLHRPYYQCVVARALRCTVRPLAIVLLWVGSGSACLADGGGKAAAGIEPAYVGCLSARPKCKNVVRTQFRLQYTRFVARTFSVRVRVLRAYQLTLDDDRGEGSSEEQQTSNLSPPFDGIDIRLRFTESGGRDRLEARTGDSYQHSNPNTADGYHALYMSGDYYFGPPIRSGRGGLSRRLDVLVRVSHNTFAAVNRSAEEIIQFVPTYTVPLTSDGSTRVYASYARELRFSGGNRVRTPSNRFELGVRRNVTRSLQLYGRISLFGTRSVPGTGKLVLGVDITL